MCRSLAACCDHGRLGQHDPGSLLAVAGSREGLGSLILQLRFWFFFVVPLFRFALFIYLFFLFLCAYACALSHIHACGYHGGQRRLSDPLELKLKVVMSLLM